MSLGWISCVDPPANGLEQISASYREAVSREGAGVLVLYAAGLAAFVLFLRWAKRSIRKQAESEERRTREHVAQHEAAISSLLPPDDGRTSIRVPAHRRITVTFAGANHPPNHAVVLEEQLEEVGADGLSFHARLAPPAGAHVSMLVDIGERHPLALGGRVAGVGPDGGRGHLVTVAFEPGQPEHVEHLARWIARCQREAIVLANRLGD